MNDPVFATKPISVQSTFCAKVYPGGVSLTIVDQRGRILMDAGFPFDRWGKLMSGGEVVETATTHAPVLHAMLDQALAPFDHKVQIVPVRPSDPATGNSLVLQATPTSPDPKSAAPMDWVTADEIQRSAALRVIGVLRGPWQRTLLECIPDRNVRNSLEVDLYNAAVGLDDPPNPPKPKVTMDGVLSSASVSVSSSDPAPVDYSLAPALVDTRGLHRHRFAQNPEEQRFADAWQEWGFSPFVHYLLRPASEQSTHSLGPLSDRDREVAATIVQWLGSPVGQAFLRDLGYEKQATETSPCHPS